MMDGAERMHLVGDVPALVVIGIVLLALMPRPEKPQAVLSEPVA